MTQQPLTKHGIAVREKNSGKLIEFIETRVGENSLTVLSGIRRNLGDKYKAEESMVKITEIEAIKS